MSESIFYDEIISCRACPRLVKYRESVPEIKEAPEGYWKKPVPGFGNPRSKIMIIGLAPSAQGGNRTGRVFTGDRSGDFLFEALYRAGYSNKPTSINRKDGLEVNEAYITAVVKCAPPENKPITEEARTCSEKFLKREIQYINPKVIVVLGSFAYYWTLKVLDSLGEKPEDAKKFSHGCNVKAGPVTVICSYHPSPQNTFTKKLTMEMLVKILKEAMDEARKQ
ncbi:MAG: uracil-DNA glycosylase [Nitrososphaeria archaeon]|nr:uracil-DNA glycosylase [Conexivisphaerales archaeon]